MAWRLKHDEKRFCWRSLTWLRPCPPPATGVVVTLKRQLLKHSWRRRTLLSDCECTWQTLTAHIHRSAIINCCLNGCLLKISPKDYDHIMQWTHTCLYQSADRAEESTSVSGRENSHRHREPPGSASPSQWWKWLHQTGKPKTQGIWLLLLCIIIIAVVVEI